MGIVAEAIYLRKRPRSREAMAVSFGAYPLCELNQIHAAGLPEHLCTMPIDL
jgi:hypothetical protein